MEAPRHLERRLGELFPPEQGRRTDLELPDRDREVRQQLEDDLYLFRQLAQYGGLDQRPPARHPT